MGLVFREPAARAVYAALEQPADVQRDRVQPVQGASRLTIDPAGREIWLDLCAIVFSVTGKLHMHKPDPDEWYDHGPEFIKLPEGDAEALIHELCHWITSRPQRRSLPNLGLNDDSLHSSILSEERVWLLETWLFSPYISEQELTQLVSLQAGEFAEWNPDHLWVSDIPSTMIGVMVNVCDSGLNVEQLRAVLRRLLEWYKANPVDSTRADLASRSPRSSLRKPGKRRARRSMRLWPR